MFERKISGWRAVVVAIFAVLVMSPALAADRVCEPIRIETCRDLGYNVTGMPNLVGHELQQDAQLQLQTFTPLIQYGCSARLRFFLCSVYAPMCTEKVPLPIGPCQALCEDVRDRCQPVLQEFGFPWPSGLNCSKFPPQNNDKHMCMEGPTDSKGQDTTPRGRNRNRRPTVFRNVDIPPTDRIKLPVNRKQSQHYGLCSKFRHSEHYYYINRTQRCAALCSANLTFTYENKMFANIWVSVWAGLCFITTFLTILTSIVEESRFRYPEGAIMFISGCYNVCAIAYIVRLLAGRYESSCHMDSQHDAAILIQEGLDNVNCTLIFVMLYFFSMAAAGWWVILCITWYLSTRLRWSASDLEHYSTYYHLAVWSFPSAMTITILVMRVVDADEFIGSCYVGNQSVHNLLIFVIIPFAVYLCIGIVFLALGLIPRLYVKKDYYQHVQTNNPVKIPSERLDSLMARIGIFAVLYIFPALCVWASNVYEYLNRDTWIDASSLNLPTVEIFTLKIFMSLIMGFTTGLWMWSCKAPMQTWKKLGRRLIRRKEPLPSYMHAVPQGPIHDKSKKHLQKASSETAV